MARILIADDSLAIRSIYENMLDYLGHEVISCKDGDEVLKKFAVEHVDLMILDVQMPKKNGIEVCRKVRRQPRGLNLPIIIVSSCQDEKDIFTGLEAGANDYMLKPIQESHLIARLKNLLHTSMLHNSDYELVKRQVVLAERYKIWKILGCGRHSVVFAVEDIKENNRQKALKLLNENISSSELLADYVATANKIGTIGSEYLVKIFETGQYANRCYLVMEYIDGGNLRELLAYRKLTFGEAVHIGNDISKAIRDLAENEIIHFDVKPENILISKNGHFKLADFGMLTTRESTTIPMNAEIWSTAAYVSPEYIDCEHDLSSKSDIYSLGVALYEGLSGDNPFMSDKPMNSLFRQLNIQPPELVQLELGIPKELSDVINVMLIKNPELRPDPRECIDFFSVFLDFKKYPWLLEGRAKAQIKHRMEQDFSDKEAVALNAEKAKKTLQRLEEIKKTKEAILLKKSVPSTINMNTLKIYFLGAACFLLAICAGLLVSSLFSGKASTDLSVENHGPLTVLKCPECAKVIKKRCKDVASEKCPSCSAYMLIARKCKKCNMLIAAKKDFFDTKDGHLKCPRCKSKDTVFASEIY